MGSSKKLCVEDGGGEIIWQGVMDDGSTPARVWFELTTFGHGSFGCFTSGHFHVEARFEGDKWDKIPDRQLPRAFWMWVYELRHGDALVKRMEDLICKAERAALEGKG